MGKILLKGGTVLSVDPQVGDLPTGDVLIDGDTIAGVEPSIDADAEVVDCTGRVVIPGFVDTHRHTWEAAIRNCAPNATLDDYFVEVLDTFAPLYRPEDVNASNVAGSLECLNAGITTLVDWSHINNTPDHPDAAVQGLQETGIRALYAYGSANTSIEKYWYFSPEAIPGDDVRRIRDTYFSSDSGLLTMGLATRGPGFTQDQVVQSEWGLARELGIPITVHVNMGRLARHHLHPLLLLQRARVAAGQGHRGDHLRRPAGGAADGPRLATGQQGPPVRSAPEPVDRRRDDRAW
jgi:cytosine/adenosine deaminase-related metal-dependent hydrolase